MSGLFSKKPNRRFWISAALASAVLSAGGALWAADRTATSNVLPDLFGKATPALPKGALQVQDLQADPKGFTGSILVRGVVAMADPKDPQVVALIDSREARICKDLNCAKFYLPVRVKDKSVKPWDELDVRGTMREDLKSKKSVLLADEVVNLGSIKR